MDRKENLNLFYLLWINKNIYQEMWNAIFHIPYFFDSIDYVSECKISKEFMEVPNNKML